jgi:hypothetical protein
MMQVASPPVERLRLATVHDFDQHVRTLVSNLNCVFPESQWEVPLQQGHHTYNESFIESSSYHVYGSLYIMVHRSVSSSLVSINASNSVDTIS